MPFYFAWCGPGEAFSAAHQREDEIVFAFDIAHQEGQIPTLNIDVKNPHIGLLAPGRAQWVWLSYLWPASGQVYPLFYGRLVALPTNLFGEIVTLQFIARPNDYLAQKQAIANSLMVEPYYDPVWIDQSKLTDPDTVLETYAMMWHVDRVSHRVSISEILVGEDGTEEFQPGDSFYDSMSISFAQSPQTQVVFDGTIQWTQVYTGFIPLPDVSLSAWNGEQIIRDWPKTGDQLRGGWSVAFAAMTNWSDQLGGGSTTINVGGGTSNIPQIIGSGGGDSSITPIGGVKFGPGGVPTGESVLPKNSLAGLSVNISWQNEEKHHQDGDTMSFNESAQYDAEGKIGGTVVSSSFGFTIGDPIHGTAASSESSISYARKVGEVQTAPSTTPPTTIIINNEPTSKQVTVPSLFGQMTLQYDLNRPRTELLFFTMTSDIQPIVLLPPDEAVNRITLSMHGQDVGLPIDPGGAMPIGDPGRSSFFPSDRGRLAMQYPMLVARAHLAQAARAAKISFDCSFERALNLSCRKNALLHDSRLPGGKTIGKITEYHLRADGDRGELIGTIQIESAIGNGTAIIVNEGAPTYVDEGYVVVGYQFYSGADVSIPTGDANIVMPPTQLVDDGLTMPLTYAQVVLAFQIHQGTPVDLVTSGQAATADPTWLEIVLLPVTDQKFSTSYNVGNSTLVLPKLIDLAAPNA